MLNYEIRGLTPISPISIFSAIAPKYDLGNTVLSLGIHHLWRRKAVKLSGAKPGDKILDCATGTGSLALAFRKAVGEKGEVTGVDFCPEMLEIAKTKSAGTGIDFAIADVQKMPFENNRFDIASIAFGIRNMDDPVACLKEMGRVVRKGGVVVILELGQPRGFTKPLFNLYRKLVIPSVGGLLTGNRGAYEYLLDSSSTFPCGDRFLGLMKEAGVFTEVKAMPLWPGLAYIYTGRK